MENKIKIIKKCAKNSDKVWGLGYDKFSKIINKFNLKVGAEIGVAYGGHSEAILKKTKIEKLYGIDPYQHTEGYKDKMNKPQNEFDEIYNFTLHRLSPFKKRYVHIRKYSKDGVSEINEKLDFVYIDADHSYQGVWNDLCIWFSKINEGGIIGGHDYMHPGFPGVKKAIDEFFGRFNWEIHHEGEGVWWTQKKAINISFFIPAYNCENTIHESIKSIIEKNFEKNDELIITNDGSTDNTKKILEEFEKKYDFIKIINHKRNKGGASARNTAIENSNNEILFCLDSDNILAPSSIKPLKKYMLNTGADCAAFQEIRCFKNKIDIINKVINFSSNKLNLESVFNGYSAPIGSGNYMFTKTSWKKAGGYPDGNWLDTWGFGVRQLFNGAKIHILPNSYYYHKRGHESYWVREAKKGKTSLTALQIILPFLDRLSDASVNYIMGKKGRYTWHSNLKKKSLKITKHKKTKKIKLKEKFPKIYKVYLKIRYK